MLQLIVRRLLISLPLVLVVSLVTFVLQSLAPGDTARALLGADFTPEGYEALRHKLGLDQPLLTQYWNWLTHAVRGDLGVSPISGIDVSSTIGGRLGVTLSLIIATTLVSALLGIGLGLVSAVRGGRLGRIVDVVSLVGFALPAFWLGLVLIAVFAVLLPLFPATGYVPPNVSLSGWAWTLVLPVAALALHSLAAIAKQTRDSMLNVLARDFIDVLRANGASEKSIIFRHGLRNAAIPVVTVLGLLFVSLLGGTVLVETVFAMPGLGSLVVDATAQHDLPVIQGVAFTFVLIVVLVNLLVDIAYGWLNPKVRVR